MKKNNTLIRAETIITKCKDDNSKYYRELVRTYKEYKGVVSKDKVKNDLYIQHINDLCNLIIARRQSNATITLMLIILFITIALTSYSSYKYLDITNNLKNNVLKVNKANSLIINYRNLESFNAFTLTDEENYQDLTPLTLNILNHSLDNKDMHYDIYILEDNDGIQDDLIIPHEAFLYNVNDGNRSSRVKKLSDAYKKDNKIKIFSGSIRCNEEINVNIRMWLDEKSNTNYLNKVYRFKIFVDGYVI